jgi:3-dehydroquinate dehydratase II
VIDIIIINGPNLNLLGTREPEKYGNQTFDGYLENLRTKYKEANIIYYQSNIEGEIVNAIQQYGATHFIIINPAAYTHTSIAIGDALLAVKANAIEVHISNVKSREEFRHISFVSSVCIGTITGLGMFGYEAALEYFLNLKNNFEAILLV